MKAIAVVPGQPDSVHLADLPKPHVDDVPDGRGVLVKVLRVGVDGVELRGEPRHGEPGLEASVLAAGAARTAVGADDDVADLARGEAAADHGTTADDEAGADGLTGLRRAAAAHRDRTVASSANLNDATEIVPRPRQHNTGRLDLIHAGVSRVECP